MSKSGGGFELKELLRLESDAVRLLRTRSFIRPVTRNRISGIVPFEDESLPRITGGFSVQSRNKNQLGQVSDEKFVTLD